jgi:hypothetical protein
MPQAPLPPDYSAADGLRIHRGMCDVCDDSRFPHMPNSGVYDGVHVDSREVLATAISEYSCAWPHRETAGSQVLRQPTPGADAQRQ